MDYKKLAFLFAAGLFLAGFSSCKETPKTPIKKAEVAFKKEGELQIYKAKTDSLLTKLDIEIAETDYETQTGLMYRHSMAKNRGMLFIFPDETMHYFYMKNTEFPLDIIYVDQNLKIASFAKNATPYDETSLPSEKPVKYVLEINGGLSDQWNLQVGDSISYSKN